MTAILELHSTNGSFIDLINISPGIHLNEWTPKIAQYKNGGVYQSSSLAEGRRLVSKSFDTVTETFDLKVNDLSQDLLIAELQELLRLLEAATNYWTSNWVSDTVYLKVKADCETNPRYAIVKSYSIPELDNPFSQPFLQPKGAVFDAITLNIERGHWLANIPGNSTAVETSVVESINSGLLTVGNIDATGTREPTTANDTVFTTNKFNSRGIAFVYHFDASTATFSSNLISAALPFNLLPAVPAVGDIAYFAIGDVNGVFGSLIFDLVAQTDITDIAWEYSTNAVGPVFSALSVSDNTDANGDMNGAAFDTAGVRGVFWEQPSNWVQATINGQLAHWVRARVVSIGASPTPPQQQNRKIYTLTWDYVEVQSDQVVGDIPALAGIKIYNRSDREGPAGAVPNLYFHRALIGLRSKSRGENFRAYLAASADQLPLGMAILGGTDVTAGTTDTRTPTGDKATYSPAAQQAFADRFTWLVDPPYSVEYYGRYRAFALTDVVSGSSTTFDMRINVKIGQVGQTFLGKSVNVIDNGAFNVVDLGTIEVPGTDIKDDEDLRIHFVLQVNSSSSGVDLDIFGLFLLPVDEWAVDTVDNVLDDNSSVERDYYLDTESVKSFKSSLRSIMKRDSDDEVFNIYFPINNGPVILQANATQRYWFFFMQEASDGWLAPPTIAANVAVVKNDRYLGMRGNR